MSTVQLSSYGRYLAAKQTVDDRALNVHVLERLRTELRAHTGAPLRVLEIGAGIGTMPARLHELGMLRQAEYVLLDADPQLLREAHAWCEAWARKRGLEPTAAGDGLAIRGPETALSLRFVRSDIEQFLVAGVAAATTDLLIANAVLDLIDLPTSLPRLLRRVAAGGLYWFSINFDGETIFLPEHASDAQFMAVYHHSMDQRRWGGRPAGDSRTGRHMFAALRAAGARICAAGSSDWVVFAEQGSYPHEEAEFMRQILGTVDAELRRHAEIDSDELASWVELRAAQIERGELIYIAHQLDFVGRTAA